MHGGAGVRQISRRKLLSVGVNCSHVDSGRLMVLRGLMSLQPAAAAQPPHSAHIQASKNQDKPATINDRVSNVTEGLRRVRCFFLVGDQTEHLSFVDGAIVLAPPLFFLRSKYWRSSGSARRLSG